MDLLAKTVKNDLSGLNEVGTEFEHYLESILSSDFQPDDNEENPGQMLTSLMTAMVMAARNGLDTSEFDTILQGINFKMLQLQYSTISSCKLTFDKLTCPKLW